MNCEKEAKTKKTNKNSVFWNFKLKMYIKMLHKTIGEHLSGLKIINYFFYWPWPAFYYVIGLGSKIGNITAMYYFGPFPKLPIKPG